MAPFLVSRQTFRYYIPMFIQDRDLNVIQLVSRFNQLSSHQIRQLVFYDTLSNNPADRSLTRLVERGMLARIERRRPGGARGGSGQYVYQLGPTGHKLCRSDADGHVPRYIPARAIRPHTLAIADCFVALHQLGRDGKLTIAGYLTEPDCHVTIADHGHEYQLKPDLYVELVRPDGSNPVRLMIEIDMATQGQKQITDKLVRYWRAREAAVGDQFPVNQFVVFVAIDETRAAELRWILAKGDEEQRRLFRVHTLESFTADMAG